MNEEQRRIKLGVKEISRFEVKTHEIKTINHVANDVYIGVATNCIFIFDHRKIKEYYYKRLKTGIYINELRLFLGITDGKSCFCYATNNVFNRIQDTDIDPHDKCIHTIQYMPAHSRLITVGEHLTIWDFKFIPSPPTIEFQPAKLIITRINVIFYNTKVQIINPPVLDQNTGQIFVCNADGNLNVYTKDGEYEDTFFNMLDYNQFAFDYFPPTRELLSTNPTSGLTLWHTKNVHIVQYSIPSQYITSLRFINEEFAIILTTKHHVILADYRTGFSYTCFVSDQYITRFYVFNSFVYIVCRNEIRVLEPIMPWRLWARTAIPPVLVQRVPKFKKAARILALCQNSQIRLLSPKNGQIMTALTLSNTAPVQSLLYDRGIEENSHDQLFTLFDDGKTYIFSTAESPCVEVGHISLKATSMLIKSLNNKLCYILGTSFGHLIFLDYETLKQVSHTFITTFPLKNILLYNDTNSLIVLTNLEIYYYSFDQNAVISKLEVTTGEIAEIFNDWLFLPNNIGGMTVIDIKDDKLTINKQMSGTRFHSNKITGIAKSDKYLITSSEDCSIRIWTKTLSLYASIEFPVPILCCCFLNGNRDILVGADENLMKIEGKMLFENVEEEDVNYDNFDKLKDELMPINVKMPAEEEEEEKQENLLTPTKQQKINRKSIRRQYMERMLEERRKRLELESTFNEWKPIESEITQPLDDLANAMDEEIKREEIRKKKEEEVEQARKEAKRKQEEEDYEYVEEDEIEIEYQKQLKARLSSPKSQRTNNSSRASPKQNNSSPSTPKQNNSSSSPKSPKQNNSPPKTPKSSPRSSAKENKTPRSSVKSNPKPQSKLSSKIENSTNESSEESNKTEESDSESFIKEINDDFDEEDKNEVVEKINIKPRTPPRRENVASARRKKGITKTPSKTGNLNFNLKINENTTQKPTEKAIDKEEEQALQSKQSLQSSQSHTSSQGTKSSKSNDKSQAVNKPAETEKIITVNVEEIGFNKQSKKTKITAKVSKNNAKIEKISQENFEENKTQSKIVQQRENVEKKKPKTETVPVFRNDPDRFDYSKNYNKKYEIYEKAPKEPEYDSLPTSRRRKTKQKKSKQKEFKHYNSLESIDTQTENPTKEEDKNKNEKIEKSNQNNKILKKKQEVKKVFVQRPISPQPIKRFTILGIFERQEKRRKRAATPTPRNTKIFDYECPYNIVYDIEEIRCQTEKGESKYSVVLERKAKLDATLNPDLNCFKPDNYEKPETKYIITENENIVDFDDILNHIRNMEVLREFRNSKRKSVKKEKTSMFSCLIPLSLQRGRNPIHSTIFKSPFATRRFNQVVDLKSPQQHGIMVLKGSKIQTLPRLQ